MYMMQIEIKGETYNLKYTYRALMYFEQITGNPFQIKTFTDHFLFFYCMLLASNRDRQKIIEWDDFLNAFDEDPQLFQKINDMIEDSRKKDALFNSETENDSKKKVKHK